MRYSAESRLTVKELMERVIGYFGPGGTVGLAITEQGPFRIVFAGGGGYVIVSARRAPSGCRIELEVQEFDREAQAFLGTLPGPESWFKRRFGRAGE